MTYLLTSEADVRRKASFMMKDLNITESDALDLVSKDYGFTCWFDLQAKLDDDSYLNRLTEDSSVSNPEFREDIRLLVEKNKKTLVSLGVEFSIFEPTNTGFKKAILDATQPVRTHFEIVNFHNYAEQQQGQEHKVIKPSFLFSAEEVIHSQVSLYRPVTKSGDPRMWFRKLPLMCQAGDQIAIIIVNDCSYLVNLSRYDLEFLSKDPSHPFKQFVDSHFSNDTSIVDELFERLSILAQSPFPTERAGDTGIGYTLEKHLGIAANSSKAPDYKGIELKSGRGGKNRTTLFAQVSDWGLSQCKSSADILGDYGYQREDDFRLYCTVSSLKPNSQGLNFKYDPKSDQLEEWYLNEKVVAVWPGKLLRARLKEKHGETFWIEAESTFVNGVEHFQLKRVTHTRTPILSQLIPLIVSGVITMDHLIKKDDRTNKVSEKGPLFKMNKRDLEFLFPKPITYSFNA